MVRSWNAKAGTEATVFGPAISTWPMVRAKNRVTSSTKSGSVLPSQGSWPFSPSWPRWPIAQMQRTSIIDPSKKVLALPESRRGRAPRIPQREACGLRMRSVGKS